MTDVIRVLLADDHSLVRAGIRLLLEGIAGVSVVAEAEDGHEALKLVAEHKPDVALLDITMPGLNGLDATARVIQESPRTRVIILTMHADDEYIRRAIQAGAAGYLLKNSHRHELELAIRAVAGGEAWLSPAISKRVIVAWSEKWLEFPPQELTARQREVLQLIAEGLSTREIARRLSLSVKTVDSHRTQLMDRLGIHGIAALVRYAIREGIVSAGR
jgi:DNA-binding NarL/FixJ family response regulator